MIKPTAGYVLILPDRAEEKTASGLYLPDNAQDKPQRGVIVAIDPSNNTLTEGSAVYYRKWGGDEVKFEGNEYKIVKVEDVIAVVED